MILTLPRALATHAVAQLAAVDYTVANRVSEHVASVVAWAYAHDAPWLARDAVALLQAFDDVGSVLISVVVWIVAHTP